MLALKFVHLIIERASRYPREPLIGNSYFARNATFSQTRSHIVKWTDPSFAALRYTHVATFSMHARKQQRVRALDRHASQSSVSKSLGGPGNEATVYL